MNKLIITFLIFGFISCAPKISNIEKSKANESTTYDIEFVRAARINGNPNNNLSVVFLVTPKYEDAFPAIVSMKLRYILDGKENYVNLGNQEGRGMIQTVLYGNDVKEKDAKIYSIVKDKIQFDQHENMLLLVFEFNDKIDMDEKEMGIIYGLWEKNQKDRFEKRFDFKIESIDSE